MKYLRNCLLPSVVSLLSLVGFGADASAEDPVEPIRVLILTGRNNHNWKETTPMLQRTMEASGGFLVDTTVPPLGLTRENLNNYDVILSN